MTDAARTTAGSCAALAAALLLAAGCAGTPARPKPPTHRYAGMVDAERDGRHLEAIAAYEAVVADESLPAADRVRARLRLARCREERKELVLARREFQDVLARADIEADEDRLPDPAWLGIHFRLEAETGLVRVGGSPEAFYASRALTGGAGTRLAAVRSLGRLKADRGRSALATVAQDEEAPGDLRAAAREALEALDRAAAGGGDD